MDWLAGFFEICGAWLVGDKKKIGFLVFMAGNISWAIVAITMRLWGLLFMACVFFGINIRNYWKWKNETSQGRPDRD